MTSVNLKLVIVNFFCPKEFGRATHVSKWRVSVFVLIPLSVGVCLAISLPAIPDKYQGTFFQIFALVATVFTAMLPLVQTVAQKREPELSYDKSKTAVWRAEVVRLDVLRSLYSALTWAVLLTVASTIPLLLMQIESFPAWAKKILAVAIYSISISIAFIFIDVVVGIYLLLADETRALESKLEAARPRED